MNEQIYATNERTGSQSIDEKKEMSLKSSIGIPPGV
jgi:hypothetical protein